MICYTRHLNIFLCVRQCSFDSVRFGLFNLSFLVCFIFVVCFYAPFVASRFSPWVLVAAPLVLTAVANKESFPSSPVSSPSNAISSAAISVAITAASNSEGIRLPPPLLLFLGFVVIISMDDREERMARLRSVVPSFFTALSLSLSLTLCGFSVVVVIVVSVVVVVLVA
jgi:hypothetical protein